MVTTTPTGATKEEWDWRDYAVLFAILGVAILGFSIITGLATRALLYSSVALMIIGLRRPALIIGAILIVELTIINYTWGVLGPLATSRYGPILVGAVVALISAPMIMPRFRLGPGAWPLLLSGAVFIVLAIMATSVGMNPAVTMEAARFFGAGLILMFLIPVLINDKFDLKLVGKVAVTVFALSALAALLQGLPDMPSFTAVGADPEDFDGRAVGLTRSPIQAANTLVIGFLIVFAMSTSLKLDNFWGVFFFGLVILTGLGWFYTFTRSAMFGVAAGLAATIPLLRGRVRTEVFVAAVLVVAVVASAVVISQSRFSKTASNDRSAASRLVLWKVGLAIARDNLSFGTGYGTFSDVAPNYLGSVDVSEQEFWFDTEETVRIAPVHNDYLRVWQEFGTAAAIVFLLITAFTALNALRAYARTDDPWLRGATVGIFAALVGYSVNSFFHNYLNVSYALWILAGLSIALVKITHVSAEAQSEADDVPSGSPARDDGDLDISSAVPRWAPSTGPRPGLSRQGRPRSGRPNRLVRSAAAAPGRLRRLIHPGLTRYLKR